VLPTNRLASLRAASGLSRADVASQLGLKTDRTVYRWETGESGIPDATKLELARMFGVSVAWLMNWTDDGDGDGGRRVAA
jgi:transcriptional regulator with XRE-family HTH domain